MLGIVLHILLITGYAVVAILILLSLINGV